MNVTKVTKNINDNTGKFTAKVYVDGKVDKTFKGRGPNVLDEARAFAQMIDKTYDGKTVWG